MPSSTGTWHLNFIFLVNKGVHVLLYCAIDYSENGLTSYNRPTSSSISNDYDDLMQQKTSSMLKDNRWNLQEF